MDNSQGYIEEPIRTDQKNGVNFIIKERLQNVDDFGNYRKIIDNNYSENKLKTCCSKLKQICSQFNISYIYLMVFNMTTASTYIACISFQTVFLTVFYKIDYAMAKNIEIFQPLFFIVVIVCWLFVSKYIKNDGAVL